jgi:hypothetical protein
MWLTRQREKNPLCDRRQDGLSKNVIFEGKFRDSRCLFWIRRNSTWGNCLNLIRTTSSPGSMGGLLSQPAPLGTHMLSYFHSLFLRSLT